MQILCEITLTHIFTLGGAERHGKHIFYKSGAVYFVAIDNKIFFVIHFQRVGKSRSALANSLRLLSLPETVLELLKSGFITIGHAKVVLGLPTPELQEEAAQMIADNQLNVRQAEALCKKLAKPAKEPVAAPLPSALPVEVEESLKQALGSEVRVAYHDGKGKLTVHFYSDDQLKAFANLLGQYSVE